ncbi:hypothetical protein SAMN00017405_0397 [Desulfonispora thiosulfatigenes DSM 11270]|uniref:Uncharacterized protein n=1 Tax=Desulfonispora thiosulfatigenes DSM 11270 TaxID=656914 RepID=A0A1W1VPV8_DESTI|nr:hypothetical protein [Desulfonispora thiosulfatigenes]SMB95415.1 hypothetical protein SAMN00017405_0397 [Desulfonispora thiosulfatigenes DSM 11270]
MTLSKICDECKNCKNKDACNNKRMVACALAEMSKPNLESRTMPNTAPLRQPFTRKHTPITIKMGEYGNINTSMEEINNKISQQINKGFQINCAFNKS